MAFAQGSRSSLAYIAETTFGTTPSTPTFANLPINSHSLDLTKDRVEGNEIQADRMSRVDRHGNKQAGGSIEVDLLFMFGGNNSMLTKIAFLHHSDRACSNG